MTVIKHNEGEQVL